MSDLFDEASFPTTTRAGKTISAVSLERAREISRFEEDRAAYFATAPLRAALIDLIPLARLAMASESNADVRAAQARVIGQADRALQALRQECERCQHPRREHTPRCACGCDYWKPRATMPG